MAGIEITVLISILSTIIFAGLSRSAGYSGIVVFKQIKAQWTKIFLKKRLKKALKKCSYTDFEKVIYDIKNYDTQFEKSLYNTIKTKYNITDEIINCRIKFTERFGLDNKNNIYEILDFIDKTYNELKIKN